MSRKIADNIASDMRRLRKLLDRAVADAPGSEPLRESLRARDEARILDVACGACHEAEVLVDLLAEVRGDPPEEMERKRNIPPQVRLTGVDLRAREIADARARLPGEQFEFFADDATKLDGHVELEDDFDLVFLRHQNYWNDRRVWDRIFDRALEKTGDEGRLVITSYFDREHTLALEAIERLGGELLRSEFHGETRELPTPGKSVDRHVAVFRRG